ncbi:hypothetical protein [Albibacterium indicum]|uniref:hypothetical protein n=1 Tax=Albibacterium indicum TaxID=2292082 RepID=UPI001300B0B0|nr:hypothetical protein [Pedobacter indicus]
MSAIESAATLTMRTSAVPFRTHFNGGANRVSPTSNHVLNEQLTNPDQSVNKQ